MCQIIHKPAGFSIPKNLIESTCLVNPDGFGIMLYDEEDKQLYYDKAWEGDNDVETIYPILEKLQDKEMFIHFRYRTKGKIDQNSCHPFLAFEGFDRQVVLMHNGTLSGFGSDTKVDSQDFAETIVGPLYETFLKSGVRDPLSNELYLSILAKYIGSDSKVVILDNTGDYIIFNKSKGTVKKEEDGTEWWVSNTYSFDRTHREPTYNYSGRGYWSGNSYYPFRNGETNTNTSGKSTTSGATNSTSHGATTTPTQQSGTAGTSSTTKTSSPATKEVGTSTSTPSPKKEKEVTKVPERTIRQCYWQDILKLDSIDEMEFMTFEEIEDLVDLNPDHAKLLINDLLVELFDETIYS